MKIKDIHESTVAGSIASVAKPLGELQTRSKPEKAPKVVKGKKYANTISEGAMKKLAYDLLHMDADEFKRVYNQAKEFFKKGPTEPAKPAATPSKTGSKAWHDTGYTDKKAAQAAQKTEEPIQEDELKEEDLIIMPGMIRSKDKSFTPHEKDRRDHEVEMARSDVYAAAKDAMRIFKILENRTEDEGLMGWQQSYITLAADYLNSVADSLDYDSVSNEGAVGKIVNAIAKQTAKDLPRTPETQRAMANHAMKIEKNLDRVAKVGTAAIGGAAAKDMYDKSKKSNEGVIAGGMSNFEEEKIQEIKQMSEISRKPTRAQATKMWMAQRRSAIPPSAGENPVPAGMERVWSVPSGGYVLRKKEDTVNKKEGVAEGEFFKSNFTFAKDSPLWKKTISGGTGTKEDPYTAGFGEDLRVIAALMRSLALQMAGLDPSDPSKFGPTSNKLYYKFNDKLYMGDGTNKIMLATTQDVAEGRPWNPLDYERSEEKAMDQERRDFKRRELEAELAGEEEAARRANEGPWYIRINGKIVKDKNQQPYVFNSMQAAQKAVRTMRDKSWNQGKEFSYSRTPTDAEKKLDEKKDACYNKVKSRYKVWPSAYASGALSKCRKVGASNWGNKSKK